MKKYIILLSILLLLFVAACGKGKAPVAEPITSITEATPEPAPEPAPEISPTTGGLSCKGILSASEVQSICGIKEQLYEDFRTSDTGDEVCAFEVRNQIYPNGLEYVWMTVSSASTPPLYDDIMEGARQTAKVVKSYFEEGVIGGKSFAADFAGTLMVQFVKNNKHVSSFSMGNTYCPIEKLVDLAKETESRI